MFLSYSTVGYEFYWLQYHTIDPINVKPIEITKTVLNQRQLDRKSQLVSLTSDATRPVGYSVPSAGEALPWTSAFQPCRCAGKLGYCMHPFLPSVKYYQWSKTHTVAILRQRVCVCIHFVCTCTLHVFPESQWREKKNIESSSLAEIDTISQKHIETLCQICRTHPRYTTTPTHNIYLLKFRHSVYWRTCSTSPKQTDSLEGAWIHQQPIYRVICTNNSSPECSWW